MCYRDLLFIVRPHLLASHPSTMAGAQCCENPPILSSSYGAGAVQQIAGLNAYTAGSPDSKLAVLLVSDIFGYEAPNLRKLADKIASAGFLVVVPDFLYDDPYVPDKTTIKEWLNSHDSDKACEDAKNVLEALKAKGKSAIGAAGFCWGAKVVVQLARGDEIDAAILLHPSLVTIDDIKAIKANIAILGAEIDQMSPPELLKQFEEILSAKPGIDSFVKVFPGVAHGWTVRYDANNEHVMKKAEEAHRDMLSWFTKYVK